ncbi:MAG: 7-cyano-7-deazaguanine synthase [bacterium]
MPYSDGLDSLAVARLLQHSQSERETLILVTTGTWTDADQERSRLPGGRVRVAVPFRLSEVSSPVRLREPSYRSRAFVYGALAGLAVSLAGGSRVLIPESGQSSLGPALCPVGGEAIDLRSHPQFTAELGDFLSRLLETEIVFDHPRLWTTKGETLAELQQLGLNDRWQLTRSCPRSTRHVKLGGARVHCGVCAACLLRRQSLLKAGFSEPEPYQWPRLSAPSLAEAAAAGARPTTLDDLRHAVCGALCMEHLARLAAERSELPFRQAAADLPSVVGGLDEVIGKLRRLVRAHQAEWQTFVAAQGAESFIADLLEKVS